ncbi:hypothetical protein RN001_013414 [Aquatica leii]|uniref:Uncharacterized protein n=1 Tax=Aquatica leii TaxID=1421715 RepID=A0AAN7PQL0_9COLE|nr:hypothetical protein RN001_013414 [Aquatica leii]
MVKPDILLVILNSEREDLFANIQAIYDQSQSLTIDTLSDFTNQYNRLSKLEEKFETITQRIRETNALVVDVSLHLNTLQVSNAVIDSIDKIRNKYFKLSASSASSSISANANSVALDVLGISDVGDFFKLQLALRNLDHGSRRAFEEQCSSQEIPSYSDLIHFVTERSRKLSLMTITKPSRDTQLTSRTSSKVYSISKTPSKSILKPKTKEMVKNTIISSKTESLPLSSNQVSSSVEVSKPIIISEETVRPPLLCYNCKGPHYFKHCDKPIDLHCHSCGKPGITKLRCPNCNPKN